MKESVSKNCLFVRCVIKDIDTGEIYFDEKMAKGTPFNIPDNYDIISQEVNDLGENWFYVREKVVN